MRQIALGQALGLVLFTFLAVPVLVLPPPGAGPPVPAPARVVVSAPVLRPGAVRTFPALEGHFAAAVVMDAVTGEVLGGKAIHRQRQPASMVKMMTELLILERIAAGELSLAETVTVSAKASRMGGSQVYLKEGETFKVVDLLKALAIHSANDAAVALAEHHSGSTQAFVALMNQRAEALGMHDTVFRFVHGLPAGWRQEPDLTSAFDMALLARELVKYPDALDWASTRTAPFRDGTFTLYNSNSLLGKYRGLDGLKTGYHHRARFCLTATAKRGQRRMIAVVLGAPNPTTRAAEAARLLDHGFDCFAQVTVASGDGTPLARCVHVADGAARDVAVTYAAELTVNVPWDRRADLIVEQELEKVLIAPVAAGQVVGKAVAKLEGRALGEVAIVTVEPVARGSLIHRLLH